MYNLSNRYYFLVACRRIELPLRVYETQMQPLHLHAIFSRKGGSRILKPKQWILSPSCLPFHHNPILVPTTGLEPVKSTS